MDLKPVSERIITARFRYGVQNISEAHCFAPTEQSEEAVKDQFYEQLSKILQTAKMGAGNQDEENPLGRHGVGERYDNEQRLVDLRQKPNWPFFDNQNVEITPQCEK